ncbi:hypothetical protein [Amycolatopsis tucumanensis]|uniref:SnoaL-like domain-containing protein n=1 Tax=Amycolatopsis tucumanensis TaxID=401106 RepID=A0ABP7HGN1_9PSEU|nr:hypothetical protein [Amycolatopsis tucumanensis]MCF6423698.1 hypothetical protein [Amycolatopsis tucumanensis]
MIAMLLLLVSGCSSPTAQPGVSVTPTTASREAADVPAASPAEAARQWMIHYRTRHWRDTSETEWVDRVRPYVTDAQHARDAQLRDGATGTDWSAFVEERCHSAVTDVAAVVPPEAPGTAEVVNVLVSATVLTGCARSGGARTERAVATLVVIHTPDGSFRVDERVF